MGEIMKLTVVEDLSLACDLEPGESPLLVTVWNEPPTGLTFDEYAQILCEPFVPSPAYAYTDEGPDGPRLVQVSDGQSEDGEIVAEYMQETMIVMAHVYEEVW